MAQTGNEKSGGLQDFTVITGFKNGYRNREDVTVLPPGILVAGSQNVLTDTFNRVGIRKGYTLDGQANADLAPIGGDGTAMGVFDWDTSSHGPRNMRAGFLTDAGNDGKLQFRYVADDGTVTWLDLLTGLTSVNFNYCTFWDTDSIQTLMLAVNGTPNIYSWNGSYTTLLSGTNTAGIVQLLTDPNDTDVASNINSGGKNYSVGDVLTLTGGNNDATVTVLSIATGAVDTADVATSGGAGGSGYAVNDIFSITGNTAGDPKCVCKVLTESGGVVTSFSVLSPGFGYTVNSSLATTTLSGVGTGLLVRIIAVTGGAIAAWDFASDADHGSGYSDLTSYPTTGGAGTGAKVWVQGIVSGTITKDGTETWGEAGFSFGTASGTSPIVINGVTYQYDSTNFVGDTTTVYGVTPDPSGIASGDVGVQGVVTTPNSSLTDGPPEDFHNQLIGTLNARVFLGALDSSEVFLSMYLSFKTWVPSLTFVLTNPPTAFAPQENALYITGGRDEWYQIQFIISSDLSEQIAQISRLNTTVQQAAQSQAMTTKIANSVAFVSFEPILETFGPVENILLGPQMTDLSFPVVNDFNSFDFTGASAFYYRKFVYVAVPREGLVMVYNMTDPKNPYWEAPLVMPIARFSVIDGDLYGHSSLVSETYKLFDGTNDNGAPILARAAFSFNNYGSRTQSKGYNEFYAEGYISANTILNLGIQYDIDGCATNTSFPINGTDTQIVCISKDMASLGKSSLGKNPLGGQLVVSTPTPKFRVIKTFPTRYFYEDQISFSSEGLDAQWELLAFGPQLQPYTDLNNNITQ